MFNLEFMDKSIESSFIDSQCSMLLMCAAWQRCMFISTTISYCLAAAVSFPASKTDCMYCFDFNNNNKDNVYSAVIMAEPKADTHFTIPQRVEG